MMDVRKISIFPHDKTIINDLSMANQQLGEFQGKKANEFLRLLSEGKPGQQATILGSKMLSRK